MTIEENMVFVAGRRFDMRVWMNRGAEDPGFAADHAALQTFYDAHAEVIEGLPFDDVCAMVAAEFPRTAAVEVLDKETRCGVLLYPSWP